MRILIIDDDRDSRRYLHDLLRRYGADEVILAASSAEALALLDTDGRGVRLDVILLDVSLPDLDGIEMCRRIRSMPALKYVPIVVVTAHSDEETIEGAFDAGANDYVPKPVRERELVARTRAAVRMKQERESRVTREQELVDVTQRLKQTNQDLERLTNIDPLTGIPNRRHFDATLVTEWRRAARANERLSVLIADIDHFHAFNGRYGHLNGDTCLINIAKALAGTLRRPSDVIARYGGEEFVCILPETDLAGASLVAERMRAMVETLEIPHAASKVASVVTISIGVASDVPRPESAPACLLQSADEALYVAKAQGRNRVCEAPIALPVVARAWEASGSR